MRGFQIKQMQNKDSRMKLMAEIIANMKSLFTQILSCRFG
jgi:hypothetical protein